MTDKSDFFVVRRGATGVPNALIHDKELSYPALVLAIVMLALPAGAPTGYRALKGRGFGESTTRKALRELEEKNLRFRFRIRRGGQLRELTVVSDTPLTIEEAREEILGRMRLQAMVESEVVGCVSHPELSTVPAPVVPVDEARAVEFTARCDQGKREPVSGAEGGHRAVVDRGTVDSGATYYVGSNASSLRSEANSIQPEQTMPSPAASSGVGGVDGMDSVSPRSGPGGPRGGVDWDLIGACVPSPMKESLAGASAVRVSAALARAVGLGWKPVQIHHRLNHQPLPGQVTNLPGLTIRRVEAFLAVDPPNASSSLPVSQVRPATGGDSHGPGKQGCPPKVKERLEKKFRRSAGNSVRTS
ncbi:MAG: hypothetical protein QM705_11050 [Ancrocorticia sp.]